ncbi:hypothetical protein VOLCADRAFT_117761 [Volvox carteri f. nagariensis]|uniref:DEX1 C-terminal domain-containing protein n=1 Tax=Volvox carteri f. nagariensis TaxID=3068 RepID=D8TXG7_VOLCA|nr:uncharacterized protein VOLCADRAFT_117761 [Volvox carteri f. nagariensis]EFJ48005.1 hypothetical protein VOLCADRAFT_117761 [Volvox carteri f. nagariensis]|eukprot:XP_002951111.1 hypothetical protein VOLCADRAFT_117761 [Volvox carteri f. nagariensis]
MQHPLWSLSALLLCCLPFGAVSQLSTPVAHSSQPAVDAANKYRSRKADMDKEGDIQHEGPVPGASRCGRHRLDLTWMSEATSSVYATPLITDLHGDGRRDIVVPSFVHYLEVLEGPNGGQAVGWPAFHASSVHASPLLYDIDFDGVRDIMLATYDGQIMFFKDTGEKMLEGLQISRLRVRKDWYVGLDPKDPFDHSHPDVSDGDGNGQLRNSSSGGGGRGGEGGGPGGKTQQQQQQQGVGRGDSTPSGISGGESQRTASMEDRVKRFVRQITEYRAKYGDLAADKLMEEARATNVIFYDLVVAALKQQLLQQELGEGGNGTSSGSSGSSGGGGASPSPSLSPPPPPPVQQQATITASPASRRRLMQLADGGDAVSGAATVEMGGAGEAVSQEAADSFQIFEDNPYADVLGDNDIVDFDQQQQLQQVQDDDSGVGDGGDDGADSGGEFDGGEFSDGGFDAGRGQADDAEATMDLGAAAGGGGLESFLGRLEYDEFGDLESTAELRESDAALHEHGDDPRAANPDELQVDSYRHLYLGDYHGGSRAHGGWGEEDFVQSGHPDAAGGYVYVDPHVMTTPAIADIDGDGHDELVLAVSYFYDREYYDDPDHAKDLKGIDLSKYVASGVVVLDLRTRSEKWVQHLDLSTDTATYKAYAYSSPTLVDINGDGKLEVVVGTSMGFLYVLDHKGDPVPGWPIQMGEIQAQPLVADINNDGDLEIFISDMRGNMAAFNVKGEEVWERHVRSAVSQGAVAGDIDGDGQLEVVVGTASGYIYALAGSTGVPIPNWPYRARGRIQAAPTITHLVEGTGMQVVVPAFDGFLYVVDGLQGCADVVDVGETSYAAVLVDDIDGDGALELVATTMNGNVYAFETGSPYHPLKTWTSQVMGPNGQVARYGYAGIFATPSSRRPRDVAGERLQVQFEVVDKRVAFADNGTLLPGGRGPYNVTVVLKGVGVREMAAGEAPVVGVADSFPGPGRYSVDIPCPKTQQSSIGFSVVYRTSCITNPNLVHISKSKVKIRFSNSNVQITSLQASAVVRLELVDGSGLLYSDEFALSFHMHFHRLLKWVIALPLGLMMAVLLAVSGPQRSHAA